jgi:subtilisin family serine protease
MLEPESPVPLGAAGPDQSNEGPVTDRYIVVFAQRSEGDVEAMLRSASLNNVASSKDFSDGIIDFAQTEAADATIFSELSIAVVSADPSQMSAMQTSSGGAVLSISRELIHHIMPDETTGYIVGYADGIADLKARLERDASNERTNGFGSRSATNGSFADAATATWGLQATRVGSSPFSAVGIKVAVLDTGFDATHPDFGGRCITTASFVSGESSQDGHGHGTHCIGTACGPKTPSVGPRYGIAHEAEIFVGKVLSNAGSGADTGILAGMNWAILNGCQVVSMSLGADVPRVHPPYVAAGSRALDRGTLVIAAAGNNANRPGGDFGFVGTPANSPAVIAVGALNQQLDVTSFSARTLAATRGGQVDFAGPGFQVYSSWPMPTRYRSISGTSMATPHIAGLAALWAQQTGRRGRELWATLAEEGQRLIAASVDVGGGLGLAPQ